METWCLLVIGSGENEGKPYLHEWKVGHGNSVQLTQTASTTVSDPSREADALDELFSNHLDPYRHENPTVIVITPTATTMRLLRTRLLANEIEATFRGLSHVALENLLNTYFQTTSGEESNSCVDVSLIGDHDLLETREEEEFSVETLWTVWNRIAPFVPREDLLGTPL